MNPQQKNKSFSDFQIQIPPRITQEMIIPNSVKQRHIGEGPIFIRSGLIKNRPTTGESNIGNSSAIYYATDQHTINVWNSKTWDVYQQIQTGIASARPTSGSYAGQQFYATDTFAFSIWNGTVWKSTTLS